MNSIFGEVPNLKHRTNNIFSWCGRYPTIMDGAVYRHKKSENGNDEISSSRNAVVVNVTIRTTEEYNSLVLMLREAWDEHLKLFRGGRDELEKLDNEFLSERDNKDNQE